MTWQDSDKEIQIDAPNETEYSEEDYSPLGPQKRPHGKRFQASNWPIRWIVGGILIVVVLVVLFFSGSDPSEPTQRLNALENRISQLETRLAALEPRPGQAKSGDPENLKITKYMGRFDRFEVATTKRMDDLTKRLDNLRRKIPAEKPPVVKRPAKETSATKTDAQYHLVSKGETLYSISRAYGLTLNELRRLNKLDDKVAIYPGQKLKIK